MRVSLQQIDARGLSLALSDEDVVEVASAAGLAGVLEQSGETLRLSDVTAGELTLASLRLTFGTVTLESRGEGALTDVRLSVERSASELIVDLEAARVRASLLVVRVGDILVQGRAELVGVKLSLREAGGSLSAERVELVAPELHVGGAQIAASALAGVALTIGWGDPGFRLLASSMTAPELRVTAAGATIASRDVGLDAFALRDGRLTVGEARLAETDFALEIGASGSSTAESVDPSVAASAAEVPSLPLVDLRVLDALDGSVAVDVAVDLTVPIIGRRSATHRLRIAVEQGTIDYRALESNLAPLEDALLDFAVRDGGLALERVNPLLPARGRGKPIVMWDLDGPGIALAERSRVRLAVLPSARVVGADDEKDRSSSSSSPISLVRLSLLDVDARLSLAETKGLPGKIRIERVGSLTLSGNVHHEPGAEPRRGHLKAALETLVVSVGDVALGSARLDVGRVSVFGIDPIDVPFVGATPSSVQMVLRGATLAEIAVGF